MNGKRSVMDGLDAPQWTDFTSSPQVSDDFFNRLHLEHELEYHEKIKKYAETQFLSVTGESDFEDVLDRVQITPVKVMSPRSKNNKEEKLETTVGDLLLEAMNNLDLSTKKGRANQSMANSSDTFKTPKMPKRRITRSMSASKKRGDSELHVSSTLKINDTEHKIPDKNSNQNFEKNLTEIEASKEMKVPSRIVTSFSDNKITHPSNKENEENKNPAINTCVIKSQKKETNGQLSLKTSKSDHNEDDDKTGIEVLKEKKVHSRIVTSFSNPVKVYSTSKENIANKSRVMSTSTDKSSTKTYEKQSLKSLKGSVSDVGTAPTLQKKKPVPPRIATSFGSSKSNGSTKSDGATSIKTRPHLFTSQIRRHSLSRQKRNDPYVSLAEAVSKFQKGTPKRFRSVSAKELKPGPVKALKQVTLKITRPISPALTAKTRVRQVKEVKHEQKELEKCRNRPIKANPIPITAVKKADPTKKIEKKPFTVPAPFNLTQSRTIRHFSSSESLATKQSRPKCNSSTSNLYDALNLREPVQKKVVHAIVTSEDANLAVKEEELGHFGIPTEPCGKSKKFTRTLPFSFEMRNKEFQDKKERKLKQIKSEEMKMKTMKVDFHAKPAPSTSHTSKESGPIKGKMTPKHITKEVTVAKKTTLCPFSFEERNKLLLKKKENLIKETLEKDKKAREFHANPVPDFRRVIVRGRSRENLKMEDKTQGNKKMDKPLYIAKTHSTSNNLAGKDIGNQENNHPRNMSNQRAKSETNLDDAKSNLKTKVSTVLSELNTDKRARERRDFHEKLKQKEMAEEEHRRKEEEERLAREKAETTEMRRMAETKARPMPQFKPISVIKSSKPLTDPHSPAWVRKSKV